MNLVLLAFNMLPALPLDGGRVLRSALWRYTGDFVRSTRLAGALGRAFGVAMIVLGLASAFTVGAAGGRWLALIGWFLTAASAAEARHFAYPCSPTGGSPVSSRSAWWQPCHGSAGTSTAWRTR